MEVVLMSGCCFQIPVWGIVHILNLCTTFNSSHAMIIVLQRVHLGGLLRRRGGAGLRGPDRGAAQARRRRPQSENDTKLVQKLGQLQPFLTVFPQECLGQLASFGPT